MDWDPIHATSELQCFLKALELAGVPYKIVGHRFVAFTAMTGDRMVVEEYVAGEGYDDEGGYGCTFGIVVYKWGERPPFVRHEDEDGSSYGPNRYRTNDFGIWSWREGVHF